MNSKSRFAADKAHINLIISHVLIVWIEIFN